MAKSPLKPAGANPAKAKPAAARPPKQGAKGSKQDQAKARLEEEHEAFYQANKPRIDDALGKCVKHFKAGEHQIVKAVCRMLFGHYCKYRVSIPKGRLVEK